METDKNTIIIDTVFGEELNDYSWMYSKSSFNQLTDYAKSNGLYYSFISNLEKKYDEVPHLDGDEWSGTLEQLNDTKYTIKFIIDICNNAGIDFRIIKLFDVVPHIPNDIDLYININDRRKLINKLKDSDMELLEASDAETKLSGDYLKTDIYTKIQYVGLNYVDSKTILESSRTISYQGIEYPALDHEVDLLMLIPHFILGHRRITLLDFLHLRMLISTADITYARQYAYENGWGYLFDKTLVKLGEIDDAIYSDNSNIRFPYTFEREFVFDCIKGSDGHNLTKSDLPLLYASFLIHDIMYTFEGTYLYELVKSSNSLRNIINSISTVLKSRRGDETSPSK